MLTINKAPQTIKFDALATRNLETDSNFQLNATASSGLAVTYTFSYTSVQPAAIVSTSGFVELKTSGQIQITAIQSGNNNYEVASDVAQTLKVNSANAEVSSIIINGQVYDKPGAEVHYLINCDNNAFSVKVSIKTEANAQSSTESNFIIVTPFPGIYRQSVMVTSQDGTQTEYYMIVVEKAFELKDIVVQKYNNTLVVNNNPSTNGGYSFVAYEWFKNGKSVGKDQAFSEGNRESDILDFSARYTVKMTTVDGDVLQTCETKIKLKSSFSLVIGENPIKQGANLNVLADYPANELKGAVYHIYSVEGRLIKSFPVNGYHTSINISDNLSIGMYRLIMVTPKRRVVKNFIKI